MFADKMVCERDITDMSLENAVVIGLSQGIGLFPGISRSGITMSGAVFQKFNKEEAVEYSFLLFIPATIGAMLLNIKDITSVDSSLWIGYLLGFVFALVFTYLSLRFENGKKTKTQIFRLLLFCYRNYYIYL